MSYATSVDSLLSASPSGDYKSIFSAFDHAGTSTYNANLWGGGGAVLDFSGVIFWEDHEGENNTASGAVAITKRHVICSQHGGTQVDWPQTFIKRDGTPVVRTTIDYIETIGGTDQYNSLRVLYLDADLPEGIAIYPIFNDAATNMVGAPAIKLDNENKALVSDITTISTVYGLSSPASDLRQTYYEDWISGDSGSAVFVLFGEQLIWLGGAVYGGGGSGPATFGRSSLILAACAALDARNAQTGYVPAVFGAWPAISRLSLGLSIGI